MASGLYMLWKASYLVIFLQFFSILMFFHSFFQCSTAFTCVLFKTIISLLHKLLLEVFTLSSCFFLICPITFFDFVKTCKCIFARNPFWLFSNTFLVWTFLTVSVLSFYVQNCEFAKYLYFVINNMVFLIYDISLFNDVWSLQINFALLTRVLIVDTFTCSGWSDDLFELVFYILLSLFLSFDLNVLWSLEMVNFL